MKSVPAVCDRGDRPGEAEFRRSPSAATGKPRRLGSRRPLRCFFFWLAFDQRDLFDPG
jgi:hypothetical protein